MLEEIAANHTFGDFDKVSALPVHTLFMYLKHQAIKVKAEQQRQSKT
jgi:prophage maintenance system killer protein